MKLIKVQDDIHQRLTSLKTERGLGSLGDVVGYLLNLKRDKQMVKEAIGEYETEKKGY